MYIPNKGVMNKECVMRITITRTTLNKLNIRTTRTFSTCQKMKDSENCTKKYLGNSALVVNCVHKRYNYYFIIDPSWKRGYFIHYFIEFMKTTYFNSILFNYQSIFSFWVDQYLKS